MGLTWSSTTNTNNRRRRRNSNYHQNPIPTPLITSYTSDLSPVPPPTFPTPYPTPQYPPPNSYPTPLPFLPPPPPPPPQPFYYQFSNGYNSCDYNSMAPIVGRPNYHPYHANGWHGLRPYVAPPPPPPLPVVPRPPPPPYVGNQMAKKIRNDVNVHKDSIRISVDESNPEYHLVSFTFDALVDGSITIFYFAKEGPDCRFAPLYPEIYTPLRIPFGKGLGQKFCQPSATGIDLGFFELDDLSKSSLTEDVFPLVIFAEACSSTLPSDEHLGQPQHTSSNAQITQAILEKNSGGCFQVKVVKQILWVDRVRYELRDIYGIGNSAETGFNSNEPAKDCVICMSEPKDTAVMPCRHMCMCSDCAKTLRLQTNKCPICRQPIEELLEIKVNKGDG